jgi:hypothetical protein
MGDINGNEAGVHAEHDITLKIFIIQMKMEILSKPV